MCAGGAGIDSTDQDRDWVKEMRRVSNGLANEEYCHKLEVEAEVTAHYLQDHGVKWVHHDEPNVLLEFDVSMIMCMTRWPVH